MIAINEKKAPSPAELAEIIKRLRERNKWSQAALAAEARLDVRTIQRVENGQGSSHQTRRSLARAFGFKDYDFFEKPTPIPKAFQKIIDWLEDTFELIPTTPIRGGHTLRTMLEQSNLREEEYPPPSPDYRPPAPDHFPTEFGEHAPAVREAFAALTDYLREHRYIPHELSATDRISIDADLDALLAPILEQRCIVGASLRRISFTSLKYWQLHIVLAKQAAFPLNILAVRDDLADKAGEARNRSGAGSENPVLTGYHQTICIEESSRGCENKS